MVGPKRRQTEQSPLAVAGRAVTDKPWIEMVQPIVKKCRLAIALDMNTSFNLDGSAALADLLEKMAERLDKALEDSRTAGQGS